MSMIKLKPEKKRYVAEIKTLDETHRKIASQFNYRKLTLPKKKARLEQCKKQLHDIENKDACNYTSDDIKKRAKLKDFIKDLDEEVHDIENNISEIEYYSKTDELLKDYYSLLDDEDKLFYNENPELSEVKSVSLEQSMDSLDIINNLNKSTRKAKRVTRRKKKGIVDTSNSIITYFTKEQEQSQAQTQDTEEDGSRTKPKSDVMCDRAQILDQYMILIDNNYASDKRKGFNLIKVCGDCGSDKTVVQSEGICVCQNCGEAEMMIIEAERPSYKENSTPEKPGYKDVPKSILLYVFYRQTVY